MNRRIPIQFVLLFAIALAGMAWTEDRPERLLAFQPKSPKDIVTEHRARYATPVGHDNMARLLREIAAALNGAKVPGGPYGILVKTSGENCSGYSCDIICAGQGNGQRQYDVFSAQEGPANPEWSLVDPNHQVVRPCEIIEAGENPPPPPPDDCKICEQDNARLRETNAQLLDEIDIKDRRLTELADQLKDREARIGELDAQNASLRMEVKSLEKQLTTVSCKFQWKTLSCVRRD